MFGIAFYKGTHKLPLGLFNIAIRFWTHGKYSHCEMLFSDGLCGSSTLLGGGVKVHKVEFLPGDWDFQELDAAREPAARAWFDGHKKDKYSLMSIAAQLLRPLSGLKRTEDCSEAVGSAAGLSEAWRFNPSELWCITRLIAKRIIFDFTAA